MSSLGSGTKDEDDSLDMDGDDDSSGGLSIRSVSPTVLVPPSSRRLSFSREDGGGAGGGRVPAGPVFTRARGARPADSVHSSVTNRRLDSTPSDGGDGPSGSDIFESGDVNMDLTDVLGMSFESLCAEDSQSASERPPASAPGGAGESTSLAVDLDMSMEEDPDVSELVFTARCPVAASSSSAGKLPKPRSSA